MPAPIVTVFGSANAVRGDHIYEEAVALGRALAAAGWTLCNGGYGGTMEAAARGAVEAGGHTIGVTCSIIPGRLSANAYIRQEVPTFDLFQRINTLIRLGQAYVVLRGGTGTLLELAAVWELLNKGMLRPARPLVLLGNCWEPVLPIIQREQPGALLPTVAADVGGVVAALRPHLAVAEA